MTTNYSFIDSDPTIKNKLLEPVNDILHHYTRNLRGCENFTDENFVHAGILRSLSQCKSGRDFIQQLGEVHDSPVGRSAFFGSLHSKRRLEVLREVNSRLWERGQRMLHDSDLLDMFPELFSRAVLAGDGHQIQHACHALHDHKGRFVSVNNLYLLCLHSGLLCNLAPVQGNGVYRHEMPVFRREATRWLQETAFKKKASRPLFLLDPAFIDNPFWNLMAAAKKAGADVITRMKENMNPMGGKLRAIDVQDEVNLGVDGDLEITFASGIVMRLVIYTDPETGICYQFLTTDFDLRPGVIAWLYFMRWRIEKLFDTSKNKLEEKKAWANGEAAQEIQGHFLAITHNALVLFRNELKSEHGIEEEKLKKKRADNLKRRSAAAEKNGRRMHPLTFKSHAGIQLSLQFIRSVRNYISVRARLSGVLSELRAMLFAYL